MGIALLLAGRLAAATWSIELQYGQDEIFPSVLASVTEDCIFPPRFAGQLGDPRGLIAAAIVAPADQCRVKVTLAETALFGKSTCEVVLPEKGRTYRVAPPLALRHAAVLALRHPIARLDLGMTIEIDGVTDGRSRPVRVWSINDCPLYIALPRWAAGPGADPRQRTWLDTRYLLAAYVNENNPEVVPRVIQQALRHVDRFDGYQSGDPQRVRRQVAAIYRAVHELKLKYSTLRQASTVSRDTEAQRVRLPGDAFSARQANCIDGSVLFASLFTRLGLRASVYVNPSHAMVEVALRPDGTERLPIETTWVGSEPFDDAVREAERKIGNHAVVDFTEFRAEDLVYRRDPPLIFRIDIGRARAGGIVAIAEPSARR